MSSISEEVSRQGGFAAAAALSPAQRQARGRLGGLTTAARYDAFEITAAARAASMGRFEREVRAEADARGEQLTAAEIARRADARKRLYFAKLAWKSTQARKRNRKTATGSGVPVAEEVKRGDSPTNATSYR